MPQASTPALSKPSEACPACGGAPGAEVLRLGPVPVQSVRLLRSRKEALAFPRGEISLAFCPACGFLWNRAFDPGLLDYGLDYEETQGYSATFRAFHESLARDLIARHALAGGRVVEVGCGKGEFLALLCALGVGEGLGLDPAFLPERLAGPGSERVTVRRKLLSEADADLAGDLVCCKMTLEHIAEPAAFLELVARSVASDPATPLFFQVPDSRRILAEGAFWDVYYEHCAYFTPGSLARLFRRAGHGVTRLWCGYDDQYLMIEAARDAQDQAQELEETPAELTGAVAGFAARAEESLAAWRGFLAREREAGRAVALWGGGSKAVSFVTSLEAGEAVAAAVDINPNKQGCFLPGGGQLVVAPEALRSLDPATVVVMNPVYRREIAASLADLGLRPSLLDVTAGPPA